MKTIEDQLAEAVLNLPQEITVPMIEALARGSFRIGSGVFESELAVCPIVAAAKTVGIWINGTPAVGGAAWGDETGPSPEVEDFIGWFDLCAEEEGLDVAIRVVHVCLAAQFQSAGVC